MSALGIGDLPFLTRFQVGGVWGLLFCRRSLLPQCMLSPLRHGYHASAEEINGGKSPFIRALFGDSALTASGACTPEAERRIRNRGCPAGRLPDPACHNARFGGVELWAIEQAFVLAFRTCSRFRMFSSSTISS